MEGKKGKDSSALLQRNLPGLGERGGVNEPKDAFFRSPSGDSSWINGAQRCHWKRSSTLPHEFRRGSGGNQAQFFRPLSGCSPWIREGGGIVALHSSRMDSCAREVSSSTGVLFTQGTTPVRIPIDSGVFTAIFDLAARRDGNWRLLLARAAFIRCIITSGAAVSFCFPPVSYGGSPESESGSVEIVKLAGALLRIFTVVPTFLAPYCTILGSSDNATRALRGSIHSCCIFTGFVK